MGQKSGPVKEPAEQHVKEIRRATRRQFSAEEKIRIVLTGLRGEDSIAELCRPEAIVQNLYYRWSKEFLEAGKKRLADEWADFETRYSRSGHKRHRPIGPWTPLALNRKESADCCRDRANKALIRFRQPTLTEQSRTSPSVLLQLSNSPTLQLSNSPTLQLSNSPTLQLSNSPTLQPECRRDCPARLWRRRLAMKFAAAH
jgi:transposase-like protein